MVILHDEMGSDTSLCHAMGEEGEGVALFDYVLITDARSSDESWVGLVVRANRNISTISTRLDPVVLHGLQLMQADVEVRSVRSVHVFEIQLLGRYDSARRISTARLRPFPGAAVTRLGEADTRAVLEIPEATTHADGSQNVIGRLLNAEGVPLCVTPETFNHHMAVMGGTGSGKSNVVANLAKQAAAFGKCVLLHDAKPDYGWIGRPNTDARVAFLWDDFSPYGLVPHAAPSLHRIGFYGRCEPNDVDQVIGFRASEFQPQTLAGFLFPGNTTAEQNGWEAFCAVAEALQQDRDGQGYTLDDILDEVRKRGDENNAKIRPEDKIHPATKGNILRKINTRRRSLPWLDKVGQAVGMGRRPPAQWPPSGQLDGGQAVVEPFKLEQAVERGRILLIDYSRMEADSYALVLSYFLRQSQNYRRRRRGVELAQFVDEAHRVFDNDSRHSGTLERAFARAMQEGRAVGHAVILSLQNASQIPSRVMGNVNTKIVLRQNSREEAQAATQGMGKEFADQAMQLGTGQALVRLHESRAIVFAQMAPSPYELQRTDNSPRQPVAVEDEE